MKGIIILPHGSLTKKGEIRYIDVNAWNWTFEMCNNDILFSSSFPYKRETLNKLKCDHPCFNVRTYTTQYNIVTNISWVLNTICKKYLLSQLYYELHFIQQYQKPLLNSFAL